MKKCQICKQIKTLSMFGNNKRKSDGKQSYCTDCSRLKDKKNYLLNPIRKQKVRERGRRIYLENSRLIYEWLSTHPCIDCGESDPIVLEFDHTDNKKFEIGRGRDKSKERLIEEINKCVVRCANCHRRKTATDYNWYKNVV